MHRTPARSASSAPTAVSPTAGTGEPTRRRALLGTGALVGTAGLLAACGSQKEGSSQDQQSTPGELSEPVDIIGVDEVPVGAVVRASADGVTAMIAQPTEGTFTAYSSVCTHQGCTLNAQKDRAIVCPCHSSTFDPSTGAVLGGPADQPLPAYEVTVRDGRILIS